MTSLRRSRLKIDTSAPKVSIFDYAALALIGVGLSLLVLKIMWPIVCNMWLHRDLSAWTKAEGVLDSLVIGPSTSRHFSRSYAPQVNYRFSVEDKEYVGKSFSSGSYKGYDTMQLSRSIKAALPGLTGKWENAYKWDPNTLKLTGLPQNVSVYYHPSYPSYSMLALAGKVRYGIMDWSVLGLFFLLTLFVALVALTIDIIVIAGVIVELLPSDCSRVDDTSEFTKEIEGERKEWASKSRRKPTGSDKSSNWEAYGVTMMLEKRFEEAIEAFDLAESFSPVEFGTCIGDLETQLNRAECLFKLGKIERTYQALKELDLHLTYSQFTELDDRVDKLRSEVDATQLPTNPSKPLFEFE